jgi:hypothetical protein
MRVNPGSPIPFWLQTWDENSGAYVLAHLTYSITGLEVPGSPYAVPYSGNRGIYATPGPTMGTGLVSIDYEVYLDSEFTVLDDSYLPAQEWAEPSQPAQFFGAPVVVTPTIQQVNIEVTPQPDVNLTLGQPQPIITVSNPVTQVTVGDTNVSIDI